MNFTAIMDKNIGLRVKSYRKSHHLTQEQFANPDNGLLRVRVSDIERGIRNSKTNPHFLTANQEAYIPERMGITRKELLFGSTTDQLTLIKILLLIVLTNGESNNKQVRWNPFTNLDTDDNYSLFDSAAYILDHVNKHKRKDEVTELLYENKLSNIERIKQETIKTLEDYDGFFFNTNNYNTFEILNNNEKFYNSSHLLLQCLLGDNLFSEYFSDAINHRFDEYIKEYLKSSSKGFSGVILGFKEIFYYLFIEAFNSFFNLYQQELHNYFDKNLFSKEIKDISDEYITTLLKHDSFLNLLNDLHRKDSLNPDRILGYNLFESNMQKQIISKKITPDREIISDYLNDLSEISKAYSHPDKKFSAIINLSKYTKVINYDDLFKN